MAKSFRPYSLDQHLLLPPDLRDWLPEGHLALYVSDVVDALDLSAIYRVYHQVDPRAAVAYHPAMFVKLLAYAYCVGMPSSAVAGGAGAPGARGGGRDEGPGECLEAQGDALHADGRDRAAAGAGGARAVGRGSRARCGRGRAVREGRRGDELPPELARRESRLRKIREAKAEETGKRPGGRPPAIPDPQAAVPTPGAQRNFTDPESRIMKDGATKSLVQAYNAQVAVDGTAQVIVAAAVTQAANDVEQLVPLLDQVARNVRRMPVVLTADAGYFSAANVRAEALREVDLYIPPDRQRHGVDEAAAGAPPPPEAGEREQMRQKVRTPEGQDVYRWRKAIAEPVFRQTMACRGFRRFALRGLTNVSAEWLLSSLTHNVLKLFRAGWQPAPA